MSNKSVSSLVAKIPETKADLLTVFVHDLSGSTSVGFRQADDTLSLAVKLSGEGAWHLLGDSVCTPDETICEQVRLLGSLETCLKGRAKIFIPPSPGSFSDLAAVNIHTHKTRALAPTRRMPSQNTLASNTLLSE